MEIQNKGNPVTQGEFMEFREGEFKDLKDEFRDFREGEFKPLRKDVQGLRKDVQDIKLSVDFIIENAATKDDLKGFATKDDLKGFATKDDLDRKFSTVMDGIDGVMGELKTIRQEQIMKVGRDDRQDYDITSLKTRVIGVERRVGIEPV